MFICTICRLDMELDDVVLRRPNGLGICLRCYARETESARPMPKELQRELIAVLDAIEAA